MSERWERCSPCAGPECIVCSGSQTIGSGLTYLESQMREEIERDRPRSMFLAKSLSERYRKEEEKFYRLDRSTRALDLAFKAIILFEENERKKREERERKKECISQKQVEMEELTLSIS